MNLDELQSVQSRERQASSLQHLRASFYEEAGEFIGELREERNAAAAASDNPFDDEEVERLSDEIKTAERTVESIYERRVGKVVKLASIAAAGMPYDDDGLTTEEERLFEALVERIERNRECVLSVLDGESPGLDCSPREGESDGRPAGTAREGASTGPGTQSPTGTDRPAGAGGTADTGDGPRPAEGAGRDGPGTAEPSTAAPGPEPGTDPGTGADGDRPAPPDDPVDRAAAGRSEGDVARTPGSGSDALDIEGAMGGPDGGDRAERAEPEPAPTGTPGSDPTPATGSGEANPARDPSGPGAAGATARRPAGDAADAAPDGEGSDPESVERTTVRVTADVGNIYGVDGRSYDLSAEDVVTLPARNAENLVSKHAAERLD